VKVTEQVPAADKVHVVAENVPAAPVRVKVTVPEGVVAPAPLVSATVAVQVEGWLIGTDAGAQETDVDVVLNTPVTVPLVAPLLVLAA
jgi:hypothetical protein